MGVFEPTNLLRLEEGDRIAADARVVEAQAYGWMNPYSWANPCRW